jgi:hypothetical protein
VKNQNKVRKITKHEVEKTGGKINKKRRQAKTDRKQE